MDEFIERKMLAALISSEDYVREAVKEFDVDLIATSELRLLASWCLDYIAEYSRPPGFKDFETLFAKRSKEVSKSDVADLSEELTNISEESKKKGLPNLDYLIRNTKEYFEARRIQTLADSITTALGSSADKNSVEEAKGLIATYLDKDSGNGVGQEINPFTKEAVRRAFQKPLKPIIEFGKAAGRFLNPHLVRGGFVAFLAPEKRGKSWMLLEIAIKATTRGKKAAFFQAGDMTEEQQLLRLFTRISRRPTRRFYANEDEEDEVSGPMTVWIPELDCVYNQSNDCKSPDEREKEQLALMDDEECKTYDDLGTLAEELRMKSEKNRKWQTCTACKKVRYTVFPRKMVVNRLQDEKEAFRFVKKWLKRNKGSFRLASYVNETLSMSEIRSKLNLWEKRDGFKADCVVIDYADILAPDPDSSRLEHRHQINKVWQRLRKLSEEKNCLVVTATQAAASSYDKKNLRLGDFSEDKRKYAHVTAMWGLNQLSDEKKLGILRLNEMVIREGDFNVQNQVHLLQCLSIGNPVVTSF